MVCLRCVTDLDLENSCLTGRATNGGRINEVAEHAQTHFPVFLMSLSWTVSTPSLLPCKHKHCVIAESLAPLARSNLGTVSIEHNSDICEITDEISTNTYIAKMSLVITVLGIQSLLISA